jgi:hypothetical protein
MVKRLSSGTATTVAQALLPPRSNFRGSTTTRDRERIVSLTLDPARTRISAEQIIESGTPDLDPSHGVIVAGALYFIQNSGWNELTADASVRRGANLTPAAIMHAQL